MTRIASGKDVSARLDIVVRFWCDHTPRILWEESIVEALHILVEEGVSKFAKELGKSLTLYVAETEKRFKSLLHAFADMDNESMKGA